MSHLLFIHGTGVREEGYRQSLDLLTRKAAKFLPGAAVSGCQWGDTFGARLNKSGVSIPGYKKTGNAAPSLENADRVRWRLLSEDPLLELRVMPEEEHLGAPTGPWMFTQLQGLKDNPEAQALLDEWAVGPAWKPFIAEISQSPEWESVIKSITEPRASASDVVARAVLAALQIYLREHGFPGLSGKQRDQLRKALLPALGGPPAGPKDWFLATLTNAGAIRRGSISDFTSPGVGDILRYQARGGKIRNFIGREVKRTQANVLVGHSLGGVAAVDWLAEKPRPVDLLITVGSQAPYFYEIDALCSRSFGNGLPDYFPKWINFFDRNDFLSYQGKEIFPGKVEDFEVDNGQSFPESHSAYFQNDEQVWAVIKETLGRA